VKSLVIQEERFDEVVLVADEVSDVIGTHDLAACTRPWQPRALNSTELSSSLSPVGGGGV
jgi:hypothetical protein